MSYQGPQRSRVDENLANSTTVWAYYNLRDFSNSFNRVKLEVSLFTFPAILTASSF